MLVRKGVGFDTYKKSTKWRKALLLATHRIEGILRHA